MSHMLEILLSGSLLVLTTEITLRANHPVPAFRSAHGKANFLRCHLSKNVFIPPLHFMYSLIDSEIQDKYFEGFTPVSFSFLEA